MHRQLLRITLLAAAVLTSFYFAFAEDVVTKPPKVKPPKFTLRAATTETFGGQQFFSLAFEVLNPNNASLIYAGYERNSFDPPLKVGDMAPLFQIELKRDGKWQPRPMGFCGTGLTDLELTPKSSAKFSVAVPTNNWQAVKVGIGHFPGWSREEVTTTTIWSTEITRTEIEKLQ